MEYETGILHKSLSKDPQTGALSIPIYSASTYQQKDVLVRQEFDYSRSGNPTRKALEDTLASLESGAYGYAFPSGMSAISSALMAVLQQGDHILAPEHIYGGSYRFLTSFIGKFGVSHTFTDQTDVEQTKRALQKNTKVLLLESPSNPLLKITDVLGMVALAKKNNLITIMDNTFLTPYFFRPLELGVDIVVHSATKFLGGHSDLLAGAAMTNSQALGREIYFIQNTCGNVLSPENSWLLLRGIKTLAPRMLTQQSGAMEIALWLKEQAWVSEVFYPGLPQHPGHDILKAQGHGFGAVLSFKVRTAKEAYALMKRVKLWSVAVSLGGVESILSFPYKMSHASMPDETKNSLGITENLIRLSVGLENPKDLMLDLEQAALK